MAKKKRFVFLTDEFYKAYPSELYPEIEQKHIILMCYGRTRKITVA